MELSKTITGTAIQSKTFSRGTDAISVYGNDTPPSVFSYAPENTFQYVSGTSNVNESTFISISGVFTPAKIVTSKNDSPTGESDFTIENNTSGPGTTFLCSTYR